MEVWTFRGFVRTEEMEALPTAMSAVLDILEDGYDESMQWACIGDRRTSVVLYFVCIVDFKMLVRNQCTGDVTETLLFT